MLAVLLLPLLFLPPQGDDPVVARYRLLDQDAVVDRDALALEFAFHLRRKDEGKAACEHLVESTLVRIEARQKGVMPSDEEIERFRRSLLAQIPAGPQRAESQAALLAIPKGELASSIAYDRLVRKALELRDDEPTGSDMRKLWLLEQKKNHHIVDDPDQLPVGTAVRVDATDVSMLELGRLLLFKAADAERERFVRQLVVLTSLDAMAKAAHIEVGDADLQAEIELRKAAIARDPGHRGLSFEQLLKSQGMTPAALMQSRVFRANVLQRLLVAHQHPKAQLLAEIAADRAAALRRSGPRRHLRGIFVRALEQPNELVTRDFAAAAEHLQELRLKLETMPFDRLARVESEHPTKAVGGDLGWQFRASDALPEPVLAAAFALAPGDVSQPVRCDDGVWLVLAEGVEPDPSDDELVKRIQEQLTDELVRQILRDADIRFGPVPKAAGK